MEKEKEKNLQYCRHRAISSRNGGTRGGEKQEEDPSVKITVQIHFKRFAQTAVIPTFVTINSS